MIRFASLEFCAGLQELKRLEKMGKVFIYTIAGELGKNILGIDKENLGKRLIINITVTTSEVL